MGEYIKHPVSGEEIKIGVCVGHTCESFFSREQLHQFQKDGYKGFYAGKYDDSLKHMLANPNTIYQLPIPRKTVFIVKNNGLRHDSVIVQLKKARGSVYVWTDLPCRQINSQKLYAVILGERYDAEGNPRTIFACDCCDKPFSLNKEEIDKLKTKHPQNTTFLKPNPFFGVNKRQKNLSINVQNALSCVQYKLHILTGHKCLFLEHRLYPNKQSHHTQDN